MTDNQAKDLAMGSAIMRIGKALERSISVHYYGVFGFKVDSASIIRNHERLQLNMVKGFGVRPVVMDY